jgi:ankyrin repeat protein
MNTHTFVDRLRHFRIPGRTAIILVALAWSSFAFGDETGAATQLVINGIGGSLDHRLAIINNRAFGVGDEGDVRTANGNVHIRCIEIREGTVVVEANGTRHELSITTQDTSSTGSTAATTTIMIHDAALNGDLEKVKALIKDDPNLVFSKDENGATPLLTATVVGHKEVVEMLLATKADVNAKDNNGNTPLFYAVSIGRKDLVELLLINKADVNVQNNKGATPLHFAAARGFKDILDPRFNAILQRAEDGGYKDVAKLLLANNADVDAQDNKGNTPLHLAARGGYKDVAELLLANKADVNAKDNYGNTPLHYAASHGNKDLAELLLANKAEINAKTDKGDTPLHYAVASYRRAQGVSENHRIRYEGVMELLRQRGGHE